MRIKVGKKDGTDNKRDIFPFSSVPEMRIGKTNLKNLEISFVPASGFRYLCEKKSNRIT